MKHRFKTIRKASPGRKTRKGQTKKVRMGSRNPGATKIGSVRHPF